LSNFLKVDKKFFYLLWFFGVGRFTLRGCPDGEKKIELRKLENKILCLEKSLIISKQECAQWEERFSQLEKENQAFKEKLGINSGNSVKPPSQDPFRRSQSSRTHR